MTIEARLALVLRQRRFEWGLARDEQTRAAARFVAGKTHDLVNLIQVVQLATLELAKRCDPTGREFVDDLQRTAIDAQRSLAELMAIARPGDPLVRGGPIEPALAAARAALRDVAPVELRVEVPAGAATRATIEELEHLVIALVLDLADADPQSTVEVLVRERIGVGLPCVELVRSSRVVPEGDRFDLELAGAIARRAGGELATSARRGGGEDVVVSLPAVRSARATLPPAVER